MAFVIPLINQKGGVGKTSTCFHLAGVLAKAGKRVLLVDNDPQASLTQGFFGPVAMRSAPADETVVALYDTEVEPIPEALVRPTGFEGVWIVPGSEHLARTNMLPPETWGPSQGGIRAFLEEIRGHYDLILIDCSPNLHLCSWAALVAADAIIVPLQAEDFGAQGVTLINAAVASVRSGPNPDLDLLGYLITMYDKRLAVHVAYEANLRALYGQDVFAAMFPRAKDFVEGVMNRTPVSHYKPRSAATTAAKSVAAELLLRVQALPRTLVGCQSEAEAEPARRIA
jgi:chromosome partitioning protein